MMPLWPLLAALGSGAAFAIMQVVMKQLTSPQTHPFALLHLMGYLFPVWAGLAVLGHTTGLLTFNLSPSALVFPLGWALLATSTSTIMLFLFRKFSLTELLGYRKALITLGALGADIIVFSLHFPPLKLAAIAFLLAGAILLSHTCKRLPTGKEAVILIVWCALFVLQLTLYKEGLERQPHVLSNTFLAQMFSTFIYASYGLFIPAGGGRMPPHTSVWLPGAVVALAFSGTLVEGFAYKGLPLVIVLLLTILPATLFAAHDLWRGHITCNLRTFVALGALAGGFVLLMFGH